LGRTVRFVLAYLRANLAMEMEYRAAFLTQVLSMFINDGMWVAFWVLYFTRFPVVAGWGRTDVLALWAITATGYGMAVGLFGNALRLSRIIYTGGLDVYLTQPKNVLLHVLVSRTQASAWGDVLFGLAVFVWLCGPTWVSTGLFLLGSLLAAVIIAAFFTLAQSLAFFIGNADTAADQLVNALIHFATYPTDIFRGLTKVLLFTALPAGFISYMPVGLMREADPIFIAAAMGAAVALAAAAILVFRAGLRRYESGNLVTTRL
jgi:ABC-2 type transport system permease protein